MRKSSNPNYNVNNHLEIGKELTRVQIRPVKSSVVTGVFVFEEKLPNWLYSFIVERNGIVKYVAK